ncbi:probable inactive serine protease 37 [Monodelphis domestica]|uniref:Probable inactive serine protease 37 n=1 Tax=Monodelphis domestica TaxID=13616 RepID=F7G5Q8_MONDO|nr:probable inactive serine protease 37 [Monodelphis domestica]
MKFILFALLVGAFYSDHTVKHDKEELVSYPVCIKNHFSPCVGVLIHRQCLLAAAHHYLPRLKTFMGNFTKRIKDATERTLNSIHMISWNLSTNPSEHKLMVPSTQRVPQGSTYSGSDVDRSVPGGDNPDLQEDNKALMIIEKKCQKRDLGKVRRKRSCLHFLNPFRRLCVETWKWYWLLSSAMTRFRSRNVSHFLENNISIYTNIFCYILSIQKFFIKMSYCYVF